MIFVESAQTAQLKNQPLSSCSVKSGLYFKINSKFLALEMTEKFGTHENSGLKYLFFKIGLALELTFLQ